MQKQPKTTRKGVFSLYFIIKGKDNLAWFLSFAPSMYRNRVTSSMSSFHFITILKWNRLYHYNKGKTSISEGKTTLWAPINNVMSANKFSLYFIIKGKDNLAWFLSFAPSMYRNRVTSSMSSFHFITILKWNRLYHYNKGKTSISEGKTTLWAPINY